MINCHHCGKEVIEDKDGNITIAFIEQTKMTIDFPFCNNICYRNLMIKRGYDKPRTKREKMFKIELLKKENKKLNKGIRGNKEKIYALARLNKGEKGE